MSMKMMDALIKKYKEDAAKIEKLIRIMGVFKASSDELALNYQLMVRQMIPILEESGMLEYGAENQRACFQNLNNFYLKLSDEISRITVKLKQLLQDAHAAEEALTSLISREAEIEVVLAKTEPVSSFENE
jgi:hypothetical protein